MSKKSLKINKTKQNMCRLIDPEKRLDKDHEEYQGGHVPKLSAVVH